MKTKINLFVTLLFALYLPAGLNGQSSTAPVIDGATLQSSLKMALDNGYAGSVLLAANGNVLLEKGFGLADRESKREQTAATVFSVGSISKQFTAAGIMKLWSQGKLQLEDPLSKYFPEAPADKAAISIHQLLTHTAGLPEALGDDYDNLDAVQFAKLALTTKLDFPAGEQYQYSNVGYSLLGIIIEKVSGQGYERFLRDHLWLPAGMKRTGYLLPGFTPAELAVGYRDGQRWGTAFDRPWLPDGPGWHLRANGGVLSTAGDMFRWYKALATNAVLPKSATDKMFEPQVAEGPQGFSHYGYGWVIQEIDGKRVIWHNGGNGVYNANMTFIPADDICIIASSNTNNHMSDDIVLTLLGTLWGKNFLPAEEEDPFLNNPVTKAIHQVILERGAAYFSQNSRQVLKDAGFDFQDDMPLLGVGQQLEEAGKWDEGIALFETYTELFPNIVVAWNRLGKCREAKGDLKGARAAWEKSVVLRPGNNPAVEWLKK